MDLIELYKRISQSKKRLCPSELRTMRLFQYRMTQVDFAHLIGVSDHTYVSWKQGGSLHHLPEAC
jgi:DNA-binding transcriptional regulator YiaG